MGAIIEISKLRLDGGTQPRAGLVTEVVAEYAEAMKRQIDAGQFTGFPALTVFFDGEHYWLADGFHRVEAAKAAGIDAFAADVRQGTQRDAVLYSVGVNAQHGLPRTQGDKRRAIMTLLRDDEWRQWSDREIARRAQCDHKTVARVRLDMVKTGEIPALETRTVQRGTQVYAIRTKQAYPPGVADDADVEAGRQAALAVLSQYGDRETVKSLVEEAVHWFFDGVVYQLGEGDVEGERVARGQIGVLVVTPNGRGVYRFDALQLWDWAAERDAVLQDAAAIRAMRTAAIAGDVWVEPSLSKKLIRLGLAVQGLTSYIKITADGHRMLARAREASLLVQVEDEIVAKMGRDGLHWDRKPEAGRSALASVVREQERNGQWVWLPDYSGEYRWSPYLAAYGYMEIDKRPLVESNRGEEALFARVTPAGAALIGVTLERDIEPLSPHPYHARYKVHVPPDVARKFEVGQVVASNHHAAHWEIVAMGVWPEIVVKRMDLQWEVTRKFNELLCELYVAPADEDAERGEDDAEVEDDALSDLWEQFDAMQQVIEMVTDEGLETELLGLLGQMRLLVATSESGVRLGLTALVEAEV